VTCYLYWFGAWLMHLFMVQVEVWYMLAHVIGTGCYRFFGVGRLVQVYNNISHSDSVTMVPSFYLYFRAVGRGKDKWLYPPSGCSWRT
jgi:hypothetical protein